MPITPGPTGTSPPSFTSLPGSAPTSATNGAVSSSPTSSSSPGNYIYYAQPNFDTRIYSPAFPFSGVPASNTGSGTSSVGVPNGLGATGSVGINGGLTRGFMVWAAPITSKGYGNTRASVNFLYNPTTITASYSLDASDVSSSLMYRQPGDVAQPVFAMNQLISFSLLFDRTFELWGSYSGANNTPVNSSSNGSAQINDPSVVGVDADVLALKQLTGMLITAQENSQTGVTNPTGAAATVAPISGSQGVELLIPTWLFFGALDSNLNYYGYVTDFTVTYTHFTQYMVPMRCEVDVDFALLMPPVNSSGQTQSTPSAAAAALSNVGWSTAQLGQVNNLGNSTTGGQNVSTGLAGR
jgi:hypothetical protein